jgi:hypothetical protein
LQGTYIVQLENHIVENISYNHHLTKYNVKFFKIIIIIIFIAVEILGLTNGSLVKLQVSSLGTWPAISNNLKRKGNKLLNFIPGPSRGSHQLPLSHQGVGAGQRVTFYGPRGGAKCRSRGWRCHPSGRRCRWPPAARCGPLTGG